jgi:hypothetical protein
MKFLIFLHRWLGTVTSIVFLMWFASGIVMMYAEMPELSEPERLAALPPLDASRVKLSAAAAFERAEVTQLSYIKLTSLFGRPAWRIRSPEGLWITVFADTGDVRDGFQYEEAQASILPFFTPGAHPRLMATLDEPDQWTLEGNYAAVRPLYHVTLGDSAGTELYVASATGEVVLRSTRRTRMLAWAGAIPHWLYLTALRKNGPLWSKLVIWLSGIGCFVALLGLTVGLWRFSPARTYFPQDGGSRSPYAGMLRWHHWGGLIFGVVTLTWVFSGLLSMDPFPYDTGTGPRRAQVAGFSGDAPAPSAYDAPAAQLLAANPGAKEIELRRVAGKPYYLIAGPEPRKQLVDATGRAVEPFSNDLLRAAAGRAVPQGKIVEQATLTDYDAYYYDRDGGAPLPVLRLKFDDPQGSWLYIDPRMGAIVARYERVGRVNRWLYHGLHSWDFPFLWRFRPAWDIVVLALCLGGVFLSATGIVIGYRQLRRSVLR